jgi:choline/glycine/proline betaine transport protein
MSSWKESLKEILSAAEGTKRTGDEPRRRVKHFIAQVVVPAFEEVAQELQEYGRDVEVEHGEKRAAIRVFHEGDEEFSYEVRATAYRKLEFAFPALPLHDAEGMTYRAEAHLKDRPLNEDVTDFTKDQIIESFLREYGRHLRWHL